MQCEHPHPIHRDSGGRCRACRREYNKVYSESNRDKLREQEKAYRITNPDKLREARRRRDGIVDAHRVPEVLAIQGGVCAICKTADWGKHGPCADHDHVTGMLRGILCTHCNRGLGGLKDDEQLLLSALDYLRSPPAGCETA